MSSTPARRRSRRSSWERFGGFGGTPFGEDYEYWARIAFDRPVAVSSRVTVVYLHGTGGLTESGRDRWTVSELRSARDISPAAALAIDRHGALPPERGPGVALYIRRYQDWCLRTSIALRDIRTIRRLRRIYWGRPSVMHSVLMAVALLPEGVAKTLFAFSLGLKAALRNARFRRGGHSFRPERKPGSSIEPAQPAPAATSEAPV